MKKILITGDTGFIGTNAVKFFSNKNFEVVKSSDADFVQHHDKFDYILHLAASHYFSTPTEKFESSINNTLTNAAYVSLWNKKYRDAKFITLSSLWAYPGGSGEFRETSLYDGIESTISHGPISKFFGPSKLFLHSIVDLAKEAGSNSTIFTVGNIFGPFDSFNESGRIIPSTIYKIYNNIELNFNTDGSEYRTFMYIYDLLENIFANLDSDETLIHIPGHKESIRTVVDYLCQDREHRYSNMRVESRIVESNKNRNVILGNLFEQLAYTYNWYGKIEYEI